MKNDELHELMAEQIEYVLSQTPEALADENAKLRDALEFERSENGWAREFLNRMGEKCGTKDCPSLVAYVTKLETENAELRGLLVGAFDDMNAWQMAIANSNEWGYGKGCLDRLCELRDEMQKLGIEVEE